MFVGLLLMHSALLMANGSAYNTWFSKDGISYYINVLSLSGGGLATVKGIGSDVVRASIPAEIDFGKPTPAKIYQVESAAFDDCASLLSISYPASLEYIPETYGSLGCKNLQSIYVASGNKEYSSFDGMLFNKSQSLLYCCPPGRSGKITIPSAVSTLGERSFYNCKQITSVDIPTSVVQINEWAFLGCSSLREIVIPSSVKTIGSDAFTNCGQADLFLYPTFSSYNFLKTSIAGGKMVKAIYSLPSTWGNIRKVYSGPLFDISAPRLVSSSQSKLGALSWTFSDTITVVSVSDNGGNAILPNVDGVYTVTDLLPSTSYDYSVVYKVGDEERTASFSLKTEAPSLSLYYYTTTQRTFSVVVAVSSDESVEPSEKGIYFNGEYLAADEEGEVSITGLHSDQSYSYQVYAVYNGQKCMGETRTFRTKSVSRSVRSLNAGCTTISLKGTYNVGDLTVTGYGFTLEDTEYADVTTLTLIGLKPNTTYASQFWVETAEEGRYTSCSMSVTTGALTFETQPASATSNTSSTISAATNCDAETGTGFEWRRIDAPDLVPSSYEECPVVDGVMAGSLRGLSADTYYQYRPYYQAADGTYFYGDWIGFGTADAYVYFEPTVRTLDVETLSSNSAVLTGYALAGSDDITAQGFEYWPLGAAVRSASGRQTVEASGQKMTVTLGGLESNTTYAFRAYVTTARGTTYGDEQTFTTPAATGIDAVTAAGETLDVAVRGASARDLQVRLVAAGGPQAACRLVSLSGAVVAHMQAAADGTWQPMPARTLSPGVYLLHVRAAGQTKTLKLMLR